MKKSTLVDKIIVILQQNPDEYREKREGFDRERIFLQQLANPIDKFTNNCTAL